MANTRVTCRGHSTYRTKSNRWAIIKTVTGYSTLNITKQHKRLVCQETGEMLNGIALNNKNLVTKNKRTVSRAYGGVLSMKACRSKILKAFLCEESRAAKATIAATAAKKQKRTK
ncbi:Ribosomal protein L34 [Spironucleus salmonicida]|uniref:Ribosomal protein L34 n=1 Tax=Spironucleus salmonicida TaxID=348837 RepID=V6LT43_9EUKA|nr:Ribosomal protein L34 [Spironucleus salmonicida]|eukprot:EST47428.1 Ribosomal protein L34 [Spironucleus salmonicida]